MFDIDSTDIKNLNDSDLRALIGLLCEAELQFHGLPTAGITWSGHQDAPDGGIDVRVELSQALSSDSYIPRAKTGFQVKKPDMPSSSITREMKPKGVLRESIKELVDSGGAYLIVCSQASLTDSPLRTRVKAMRNAVKDLPNRSDLKVDFYDCGRVAAWVRFHPAMGLWVRERLGRPIQGWQPYGNWAKCPDGIENEYLFDKDVRFHNHSKSDGEGMSGIEGIQKIRESLHRPASSVRLTGLSGVGKTRLLQALFDKRVGEKPLDKSQAFYTDMSDSPDPTPENLVGQLAALRKPAVIVVDNCPPDLHRRLTSLCSAEGSLLSLITVEYDVREDQPEETEVFRLEPASIDLIEKVIRARFVNLSQVNARTIANFSGGNARIAIALANTVKRGDDLSTLKDNDLFDRLFRQRNEPDKELLKAAEACSLVYSFECKADSEGNSELELLGSLVGMTVSELYRHVSELKRRELVQQRGIWRAVLPHPIANRLAQRALENIPLSAIRNALEKKDCERILKSFSRRLSYLHENETAQEIARSWLSEGGILRDISSLNELGMALLRNIAPIVPEKVLETMERAARADSEDDFLTRKNQNYVQFTHLLHSIAYEPILFSRSAKLLAKFALSGNPEERNNSIRNTLKSLFYICLSGTHATAEQRLEVISKLTKSSNKEEVELGLELLDAALEAWHFTSHHSSEFGSHSRDYGFWPKNREDVVHWFRLFLDLTVELAISETPVNIPAKALLAKNFRGVWVKASMYDELENAAKSIIAKGPWREGWVAVRTTLRFHRDNMPPEHVARLNGLATLLSPATLIERARLFALSEGNNSLCLIDAVEEEGLADTYYRVEEETQSLGKEVAGNENVLRELSRELLSFWGHRLWSFGQGLAEGAASHRDLWSFFKQELSCIQPEERKFQLLRGFLNYLSINHSELANELLDDAVLDPVLGKAFPSLQCSVPIDEKGVKRLLLSLEKNAAPISEYTQLSYGKVTQKISDEELCRLLRLIATKENGTAVSLEVLHMRLFGDKEEKRDVSPVIEVLGQELVLEYKFSREFHHQATLDYALGNIIDSCFTNDSASSPAKQLCKKLAKGFANYEVYSMNYPSLLNGLARRQPLAFLDGFLGDESLIDPLVGCFISDQLQDGRNPLSEVDDDLIIFWCEQNPNVRYFLAASLIEPYRTGEGEKVEWRPFARQFIVKSPDPIAVLDRFKVGFVPHSWSGSRAGIMESRLCLVQDLKSHENPLVSKWAVQEEVEFSARIAAERKQELEWEKERDERFE